MYLKDLLELLTEEDGPKIKTYNESDLVPINPPSEDEEGDEGEEDEGDEGEGDEGEGDEGDEGDYDDENFKEKPGDWKKIEKDLDQIDQQVQDAISKGKDLSPEELKQKKEQKQKKASQPGEEEGIITHIEKPDTPAFNWKSIIRRFVPSSGGFDTSRMKPSKKSITAISAAAATGAGALPPGQIPLEGKFKLIVVLDSSGSMMSYIGMVQTEVENLIRANYKNVSGNYGFCLYSDHPIYFAVNPKENSYITIANFSQGLENPKGQKHRPASNLSSLANVGGTIFGPEQASDLIAMANKGYNILLTSDSDMLWGNNWKNFLTLYQRTKGRLFFIAADARTFSETTQKLGHVPQTFSHF